MRIGFSARAWVLGAATGLVCLQTVDADDESKSAGSSRKAPPTSSVKQKSDERSAVRKQLDAIYSRFDKDAAPASANAEPSRKTPAPRLLSTNQVARKAQSESGKATSSSTKRRLLPNFFAKKKPAPASNAVPQPRRPRPASSNGRSPIQQRLAELYARDGLEMPDMDGPAPTSPSPQSKQGLIQQVSAGAESATAQGRTEAEPRKLIQRPATRDAIQSSRPARKLLPNIFSKKKPAAMPAPRPTSSNGLSPVQQRLAELYARDGREMPPMQLEQLPQTELKQQIPPLPGLASSAKNSAGIPSQPAPAQLAPAPNLRRLPKPETSGSSLNAPKGEIRPVANSPFKRFLSKINPLKRKQKKQADTEKPERIERLPAGALAEQRALQNAEPVRKAPQLIPPVPAVPSFEPEATAAETEQKIEDKAPKVVEFAPESEAAPIGNPTPLPTLKDVDSLDSSALTSDDPAATDAEAGDQADPFAQDLDNPFPALAEQEVDKPVDTEPAPAEGNPFSGLKLEEPEQSPATTTPSEPQVSPASGPDEPASELAAGKEAPLALPAESVTASEKPNLPAEKPTTGKPGSVNEKLQKIAERSELTGLKGFCPVVLRDDRELKDALPEFHQDFNGKVYHFSSEAALKKFQAKPQVYAPVASGQDVVLASSRELERDGTLDHAVWFKGRLYLFSTQATRDAFIVAPEKFSVGK